MSQVVAGLLTRINFLSAPRRAEPTVPVTAADAILRASARHARIRRRVFQLLVIVPTLLACVFYALIAVPRYVSETRIVVRSASSIRMSGLDMLFRTIGLSKAVDDAYVVRDYLLSRDVIRDLAAQGVSVRDIFMSPAADRLSRHPRLWREDSLESLYDFFLDRVKVIEDEAKGILTLSVTTFTAEDAHRLSAAMVRLAEEMVNRMNTRAQRDATSHALEEVGLARKEIADAQLALTAFRNAEALFDPSVSSVAMYETIGQLSTDLAYASAELSQVLQNSPGNPAIPSLRSRIAALEARIRLERGAVAGTETSLVGKVAVYDNLNLRRTIAEKRLTSAIASLETARQEGRRQHIYIEQVVAPALPDAPTEPRRVRSILTIFVVGFMLFGVYWILSVAAEEHAQ
ncbi:MAG: capsule biosynthesis protein [Beijerinckiaceae bacterium]|nr:capsule biosynthesis protein [Beijerinckiaceae bacterium]